MPSFIIHGCEFSIEIKDLQEKMKDLAPAPITRSTFIVNISGKIFSVKQVIEEVTGIQTKDLVTLDAFRILDKLECTLYYYKVYPKVTKKKNS